MQQPTRRVEQLRRCVASSTCRASACLRANRKGEGNRPVAAPPRGRAAQHLGHVVPADMKPTKTEFNRSSLIAHSAETAATETKVARAVLTVLEATILASVHKKGLGSFTLPGLLKVNVITFPPQKKRRGIDPFTKAEREVAAKP